MSMILFLLSTLVSLIHGHRLDLREGSSAGRLQSLSEANENRFRSHPPTSFSARKATAMLLLVRAAGMPPQMNSGEASLKSSRSTNGADVTGESRLAKPVHDGRVEDVGRHRAVGMRLANIQASEDISAVDRNTFKDVTLKNKAAMFERMRAEYGEEHPETLGALLDQSIALLEFGRAPMAMPLLEKALNEIVLDLNHPDTLSQFTPEALTTFNSYANKLSELGCKGEAEQLKTEILEVITVKQECLGQSPEQSVKELSRTVETDVKSMDKPKPFFVRKQTVHLDEKPMTYEREMEDYSAFYATDQKIAIAMFDFDQTLTTEHVFLTLSQHITSTRRKYDDLADLDTIYEPVAVSPAGQVSRLTKESEKYNALWAFGGKERIEMLRAMLERLRARGIKMMVCTLGFPAVQKKLLEEVDLLKYFGWEGQPPIVGVSGSGYQPYFTKYDAEAVEEFEIKELPDEILKGNKVKLLDNLLLKESVISNMQLPLTAGVIVEDDARMVTQAGIHMRQDNFKRVISTGFINAVRVEDRSGMEQKHVNQLLELADA